MAFCDRMLGSFIYTSSPMYREDLDYRRFIKERGRYGEFQLWRKAKRFVGKDARWLTNLYLPKKDGTTCEIDLVAICHRGVLVFESKNYGGWIYGDEKSPYWYQMLRKDVSRRARKYTFFNPIMQNGMHCRVLREQLCIGDDAVHSMIVFGNQCRLKEIRYDAKRTMICRKAQLGRKIRALPKNALTNSEIEQIFERLKPYTDVTRKEKLAHIAHIQDHK